MGISDDVLDRNSDVGAHNDICHIAKVGNENANLAVEAKDWAREHSVEAILTCDDLLESGQTSQNRNANAARVEILTADIDAHVPKAPTLDSGSIELPKT